MRKVGYLLSAFALSLMTGLAPATADTVVTSNGGGTVETFWVEVQSHLMRHERIVVDGPCYSACTLSLMLAPKQLMCATPRAFFSFHRAYSGKPGTKEYEDDGGWTAAMLAAWPPAVVEWLNKNGGLSHDWKILAGDEMAAIVPICPEGAVAPTGEERVLVPVKKERG